MVAIGTYAMPDLSSTIEDLREKDGGGLAADFVELFDTDLYELTRPYTLITSQWQKWTLFAPDPLRRVNSYAIEVQKDGQWQRLTEINAHTATLWNSAVHLKTIRRLEQSSNRERNKPIRESYLQQACNTYGLEAGTSLQLRIEYFVIPKHEFPKSVQWWRNWKPQWSSFIDATTTCPPAVS